MYNAGTLLIKQLEHLGIENVYLVPGESYLAAINGLYESSIRVINARHEGGAVMMAQAEAKFTNRPGIAFVTRGPGATNASSGVHVAQQDSTPLILFIGQVARSMRGKDAFQEVDYEHFFGAMAKKVFEVNDATKLTATIAQAYAIAMTGRKGPVIISLPEDMLGEKINIEPIELSNTDAAPQDYNELLVDIKKAQQISVILGGYNITRSSKKELERLAEKHSMAICCTFRRQDLFNNHHACYFGELGLGVNPDILTYIRRSDLVIVVDERLSEVPSQNYTLFDNSISQQRVIHIYPDSNEFNRTFHSQRTIVGDSNHFVHALKGLKARNNVQELSAIRHSYIRWSTPTGDDLLSEFMRAINEKALEDTIFTNGAGNYAIWLQRFRRFRNINDYVAPTSGSMGYGLPAAIAAKLNKPESEVICFAGDGCFQMTLQELATAHQYQLPIKVVVVDNGRYATIRMHQERNYPNHVIATDITNPDFAHMAQSFGFESATISEKNDINAVLDWFLSSKTPCLVHLKTDPDQLTPSVHLKT